MTDDDIPTFEIVPEHEQEEYDPDEYDAEAIGDRLKELRQEHYGDDETETEKAVDTSQDAYKTIAVEYAEVDDALFEAIQKSSWWIERQDDLTTLEKSPGIWRHDDEVPEYVREVIAEIIRNTRWRWSDFDSLNVQEARELTNLLEEKMTQPQGWSVTSLAGDIEDEFDLPTEVAAGMAADTTHNVLNTTREEAYADMEGSENFEFDWVNPMDHRTTKVCMGIIGEISDEGGSVSMNKLKSLLRKYALKYEGGSEGGTPDRVDQWQPHFGCRSSMVRRVQRL
jgi:hypothetical protein